MIEYETKIKTAISMLVTKVGDNIELMVTYLIHLMTIWIEKIINILSLLQHENATNILKLSPS